MAQPHAAPPRHWAGSGTPRNGTPRGGGPRGGGQGGGGRALVVALVAVVVVIGGLGAWTWKNDGFLLGWATPWAVDYEGAGGEEIDVEIPEGANGAVIGEVLVENDVVASYGAFRAAYDRTPGATGIQPGIHPLRRQMPAADAVAELATNDVHRAGFTVPEGFTVEQIRARMVDSGWPRKQVDEAFGNIGPMLPPQAGGKPEGWLFPQTYEVTPEKHSAADVVQKMVAMTISQLDDAGVPAERRKEVLTKASLVEREGMRQEDRARIAGVIERRLELGWTLGIDAAVLYGVGRTSGALTTAELDDVSNPYNLRHHKGLPPTPIASPGRASIDAVLKPADGEEMYWVTVNHDTGETKFAVTDAEFQELVAQLRQWEAENPDWHE